MMECVSCGIPMDPDIGKASNGAQVLTCPQCGRWHASEPLTQSDYIDFTPSEPHR